MIPIENFGLDCVLKIQRDAFNKSISQARENFLKSINERRESFLKSINQNYYGYNPSLSAIASKPILFDLDRLGAYTAMSKLADRSNTFRRVTALNFELPVNRTIKDIKKWKRKRAKERLERLLRRRQSYDPHLSTLSKIILVVLLALYEFEH